MTKQRYRYEVDSVWGSMENNEQLKVGTGIIDVEKHDEDGDAQWDIWNYNEHDITGGLTGKLLGEFEEPKP